MTTPGPLSTTALLVPTPSAPFRLAPVTLAPPLADEVLIRITASGLCHTDLSCAAGVLPTGPNAVLGHEGAGVVVAAGSAATHVAPGDAVLLSFSHCQACAQCAAGHPAYCHDFNARNFGGRRPEGGCAVTTGDGEACHSSFFGQSSFARHAVAHRSCVVKVPEGTDLALFAPLGCGMQTGAGAVLNTLGVKEGDQGAVAVFGVGSCGMAAIMAAALIRRARIVIAVDLDAERLALARELGATHTVLGGAADVVAQIREICGGSEEWRGVDYAVDCTGVPAVVRTMIDSLGMRGRAATVGAPGPGKDVRVDVMGMLTFGKEYVGCSEGDSNPSEFIPYLMRMHAEGRFPLERFVEYFDVKDFENAIEGAKSGKVIKPVLLWDKI
ncbi:putative alcohol dehydrogenase [Podospora conica]|nr:putative alcohol dehydrogenase [Schizothecium conicum]